MMLDTRIDSVKTHTVHAGGKTLTCRSVCEEYALPRTEEDAGSLFSVSYLVEGGTADRPVLFVFNGGPGSSSLWMHLGLFGPQTLAYSSEFDLPAAPPFQLEENSDCLLDLCDIVLIDPPGTGYGRSGTTPAAYGSYQKDAELFCTYIEHWLSLHDRWQSHKYLVGESYGSLRAARILDIIGSCTEKQLNAIGFHGAIILGNAIGCADEEGILKNGIDRSLLQLPAFAAVSAYHGVSNHADPQEAFREAQAFCGEDYLKALYQGERLSAEQRDKIADKLHELTGLPPALLCANSLRVTADLYTRYALAESGQVPGLYDGRYLMRAPTDLGALDTVGDDAAMAYYTPAFVGAFNGALCRFLGICSPRPYCPINFGLNAAWDMAYNGRTPAQSLAAAMRRNPQLRLFFGSGIYDLITTAGETAYAVNHITMDLSRVVVKEYSSGHMPYLGKDARHALTQDIRDFLQPLQQNPEKPAVK